MSKERSGDAKSLHDAALPRGEYLANIAGIKSKPGPKSSGMWPLLISFKIIEGPHKDREFRIELDILRHADCRRLRELAGACGYSGFDVLKENFEGFLGRVAKIAIWQAEARKGYSLASRWACAVPSDSSPAPAEITEDDRTRTLRMFSKRSYVVQITESKVCTLDGEGEEVLGLLFEVLSGAPFEYGGAKGWHFERYFRVMDEDDAIRAEARDEVSMIMQAVGVDFMHDSEVLHDRPFKIRLWRIGFNEEQLIAVAERFGCEPLADAESRRLALQKPCAPEGP